MPSIKLILALLLAIALPRAHTKPIKAVHLIFSNHLDIGFHSNLPDTPGTDANVITRYTRDYFPAAIATAAAMRASNITDRYRYLTHSFLVSLYLDCPEKLGIYCPSSAEVAAFKEAVSRGDIVWHALPHNLQAEFMSADLLDYAVQMTHELDQTLGIEPKSVVSQRDVPGLTRAAIPILHNQGVVAISVGVNSGSAPPAVPKNTPFIWKDEASGTSVFAFWHAGGYSGVPVDSAEECVQVEGFDHVLCAAWRGDNEGPHSVDEVVEIYKQVREDFPNAKIIASTFDDFVKELEAAAPELDLPVVTAEIGDTWVYGVASDPAKTAEYRALLRLRQASRDHWDDVAFKRFTRLLLKVPEHTWGTDTKEYPGDYLRWSNKDLQQALKESDPRFEAAVESWMRQRAYNAWALEELLQEQKMVVVVENEWLVQAAKNVLNEFKMLKSVPDQKNLLEAQYEVVYCIDTEDDGSTDKRNDKSEEQSCSQAEINDLSKYKLEFSSPSWRLSLDRATGAISKLEFISEAAKDSRYGSKLSLNEQSSAEKAQECTSWASSESLVGKLVYSTYDESSYDVIWTQYAHRTSPYPEWFIKDFGKPNATVIGGARRLDAEPVLQKVWHRSDDDGGLHVVLKLAFDGALVRDAGAPAAVYYEISSPSSSADLFIDVIWESKTATRLPEALWLSFQPALPAVDSSSWSLSKLGSWISPLEVIRNGSMSMHAVDDGGIAVRSADGRARLLIRSLDAALVSPGTPTPFPSVVDLPDLTQGMHYNLVNNIWGTNYVMWFPYDVAQDSNMRFRFVVQQEQVAVAEQ